MTLWGAGLEPGILLFRVIPPAPTFVGDRSVGVETEVEHGRGRWGHLTTLGIPPPAPTPVICAFCIPDGVAGPNGAGRTS